MSSMTSGGTTTDIELLAGDGVSIRNFFIVNGLVVRIE